MTDHDGKVRVAHWFRQWQLPLRKFLAGRGAVPASDLDDVAQEVFLRLMRYERAELVENPQAYLYKMASNVAAEWSIRGRNSRPHESKWLEGLSAGVSSQTGVDQFDMQSEVERALQTLDPRQREVLKLYFFEGLSRTQIAQRIGLTERAVKRTIIKSYEVLRNELDAELLAGVSDDYK
jgi:RNA polymerase sigma-70 factor (ECF subfamily)